MTFGNLNTTSLSSNPAVLPVWLTAARSSVSVAPTGLRHLASPWLPGAECGSGKVHSAAGLGSACGRLARPYRRHSLLSPSILTVSKPQRAAERWLDGYRRVLSTAAQGKLRKPTPPEGPVARVSATGGFARLTVISSIRGGWVCVFLSLCTVTSELIC